MNKLLKFIRTFPFTEIDIESIEDMDLCIHVIYPMALAETYKRISSIFADRKAFDDWFYWRVFNTKGY